MDQRVYQVIRAFHDNDDELGSYTGTGTVEIEPVQDADDL